MLSAQGRKGEMTEMDLTDLVDTHFHLWNLKKFQYAWPDADVPILFRDINIEEYAEETRDTTFRHAVFVQVLNNCPEETKWLLKLAKTHPFLKGVVGGIDLTSPDLEKTLDELSMDPKFVGTRHILDFEKEDWLTREDVKKGLGILEKKGLTFDLLLRPHLLKHVPSLGAQFPNLKMVVDHIAKPFIKDGKMEGWKEDMEKIAKCPNISCKLSGLVTEADLKDWKVEDFVPYVKHVMKIFGVDRCFFGSDWPVSLMAGASFQKVFQVLQDILKKLDVTEEDQIKIFRENAIKFYNLKI
ncbi:uncharacterized protein LOC106161506 isoform X1 [Lingula anatina]|uniref:Uncharacterized protein LOC106161506 isoform X1 n=2 Tax=Lingula anatina TaxID=7574 RepID=A0A1S3I965_LINAN|nr:uncharacterized protein LOC106161506 isoform X1 [Lingula anatina]|eukprot:XP_013393929.1 uncharacterized protein LOC106161506 isoform X1 [Lingula anatina]